MANERIEHPDQIELEDLIKHALEGAPPKTPELDVRIDSAVKASYPYEVPLPPNVEMLPGDTRIDMPVETIIRQAYEAKLERIVVCGVDADGSEHIYRSNASKAYAVWDMQRAIRFLNELHDEKMAGADVPDDKSSA